MLIMFHCISSFYTQQTQNFEVKLARIVPILHANESVALSTTTQMRIVHLVRVLSWERLLSSMVFFFQRQPHKHLCPYACLTIHLNLSSVLVDNFFDHR